MNTDKSFLIYQNLCSSRLSVVTFYPAANCNTACKSTFAPFTQSSHSVNSRGEWLYPSTDGTKIMPTGQTPRGIAHHGSHPKKAKHGSSPITSQDLCKRALEFSLIKLGECFPRNSVFNCKPKLPLFFSQSFNAASNRFNSFSSGERNSIKSLHLRRDDIERARRRTRFCQHSPHNSENPHHHFTRFQNKRRRTLRRIQPIFHRGRACMVCPPM
jgi:hypothetical protein